ncbi:uncharacterized protein LOC134527777 [Bacillus rossius redtenbacheri]|uniref:uncharacterized protein LOC134527777 n=1 Tax=Bacillus rossius redtenbacheri TaxID=93214 RepID=UPI002FDE3B3D
MWARLVVALVAVSGSRAWYQLIPGVGYYQFNAADTWIRAQDACVSRDSALAVPTTPEKLRALGDVLVGRGSRYAHAGFHQLFQPGQYLTVYGELLNETGPLTWERGAPLPGPAYSCGAVSSSGELAVLECDGKLPFVCENELWSEYEHLAGVGYYKLYTSGENWADARRRCAQDGAHLAVLGSGAEAVALGRLLARFPTLNNTDHDSRALLGFHALYATTRSRRPRLRTVTGQMLDHAGYTRWKRGQPFLGTSWHCGAMTRDIELVMVSCSHKYAFICEHEL